MFRRFLVVVDWRGVDRPVPRVDRCERAEGERDDGHYDTNAFVLQALLFFVVILAQTSLTSSCIRSDLT